MFRLVLEYDGTAYSGWQRQTNAATVEGALRRAIEAVSDEEPTMTAASRTDAGVHAHGQVVGVELTRNWQPERLMAALNTVLPEDVSVVAAGFDKPDFHARYDAVARSYRYVVVPRRQRSPLSRHHAWIVSGDLDLDAMHAAASMFVGSHDFAAFGRAPRIGGSTRRTVNSLTVRRVAVHGADSAAPLDAVVIDITANAFLYGMVRTIAGALVAVGKGRMTAADIRGMLHQPAAPHRSVAVAPAQGLHQWTVTYAPTDEIECVGTPIRMADWAEEA